MRDCRLTRTRRRMDLRWFLVGVILLESWRHVGVEGLLSVSFWGYGLSSINPTDDSSRATHPSAYDSTSLSSLISFHNENEFGVFRRSYQQANHQEQDVTIIQSLFFWFYPLIPSPHQSVEPPRRSSTTVYHFFAGFFDP